MAHSDFSFEDFVNKLLSLQAYLTYSEITTITTTQVLLPGLSTPTPLVSKLCNIMIHHPAIQHNYPSTLTTASLTEPHCNSLNILPSFTFCCMLTSSLTNIMKSDLAVSTEHPPDLTDRLLHIDIDVDTDIDLHTIASIYMSLSISIPTILLSQLFQLESLALLLLLLLQILI